MVRWTRQRVRNFTASFARSYIDLLVGLDGQPYEQALFFKFLADTGLVSDVPQEGTEEEINKRRSERWDSYLGKIREFGIGFALDENRKGSHVRRSTWRVSEVAKQFTLGRLDYREFMALQMMRVQLPRPSLPLQGSDRGEIERGVQIRPLRLIMQALDLLEERGLRPYLSRQEISVHLTAIERHDQLDAALDAIEPGRTGTGSLAIGRAEPIAEDENEEDRGEQEVADQPALDIWLNELEATGYLRQLRPAAASGLPPHIVVRNLARWEEAHRLDAVIPLQTYDVSEEALNAFYDFLSAAPTSQAMEVLKMNPMVVQLEVPAEARFDPSSNHLTGRMEIVGGLNEGALVLLIGETADDRTKGTIFEVVSAESSPAGAEVIVVLRPVLIRMDGKPIAVSVDR